MNHDRGRTGSCLKTIENDRGVSISSKGQSLVPLGSMTTGPLAVNVCPGSNGSSAVKGGQSGSQERVRRIGSGVSKRDILGSISGIDIDVVVSSWLNIQSIGVVVDYISG